MQNMEWTEIAGKASESDPRENPYGYLAGGSFVLDSVRVFVWFPSINDLIKQILEVEPRVRDIEPGQGLDEFQARVRPILVRVRKEGLTDALRQELSPEHDGLFVVDWWGHYEELRDGSTKFGRELLDEFLGEDRAGQKLPIEEESAFVEYLETCRV